LEITVTNEDPKIAKLIADAVADESAAICSQNMQISEPSVFQRAKVAESPSSPNMKKNVLIAFIAGIFVVGIIVVVRYLLDDTIKSSEDVEKYLGINTLGLIPIEEGSMEQLRKDKRRRRKDMK
jgi:capsular polysaccharide biosynthesis protein